MVAAEARNLVDRVPQCLANSEAGGPMAGKPPSAPLAFFLFFAGLLLAYWVMQRHGLHAGVPAVEVWARLGAPQRLLALIGFVGSAYGFGGLLNAFLAKR